MSKPPVPLPDDIRGDLTIRLMSTKDTAPERSAGPIYRLVGYLDRLFDGKLGTAVLTLLFSTILGGVFTAYVTDHENRMTAAAARIKADEDARSALLQNVSAVLIERRVQLDRLNSVISQNGSAAEIRSRWADYQASTLQYEQKGFDTRWEIINLLGGSNGMLFTRVLDRTIDREFEALDSCATDAYFALSSGQRGRAKAKAIVSACADSPGQTLGSGIDKLQKCLGTFQTELLWSVYVQNRFAESQLRSKFSLPSLATSSSKSTACPDRGGHTDWACIRHVQRTDIPRKLSGGCP